MHIRIKRVLLVCESKIDARLLMHWLTRLTTISKTDSLNGFYILTSLTTKVDNIKLILRGSPFLSELVLCSTSQLSCEEGRVRGL